jgi:hypothetical protein
LHYCSWSILSPSSELPYRLQYEPSNSCSLHHSRNFPESLYLFIDLATLQQDVISAVVLDKKVLMVCVLQSVSRCFSVAPMQLHPSGPSRAIALPGSPRTSALEYSKSAMSTPINKSTKPSFAGVSKSQSWRCVQLVLFFDQSSTL